MLYKLYRVAGSKRFKKFKNLHKLPENQIKKYKYPHFAPRTGNREIKI